MAKFTVGTNILISRGEVGSNLCLVELFHSGCWLEVVVRSGTVNCSRNRVTASSFGLNLCQVLVVNVAFGES